MMRLNSKIYLAGHSGMVGSSILRSLSKAGYNNILYKTSSELNLINQRQVDNFFDKEKPEYVFLAAAKVGGIHANNIYPADFIYKNIMIQANVIHAAFESGVKKLLFLGSSCIYPKDSGQPIKEEFLLSGELEMTNKAYAIAKISGLELCDSYRKQHNCNFISIMPTNLYGPNDNYDLDTSHVLPALLRKIIVAKKNKIPVVEIWGSGSPFREFLHVDDLSDACIFLMNNYNEGGIINIGYGKDISIRQLAELIADEVGYEGTFSFNTEKPDGTLRKLLDTTKINNFGWYPKISLRDGIKSLIKEKYYSF